MEEKAKKLYDERVKNHERRHRHERAGQNTGGSVPGFRRPETGRLFLPGSLLRL